METSGLPKLAADSVKRILLPLLGGTAALAGVGLALYRYATDIEPYRVQVEDVPLQMPRLGASFDGYRVVQVSDLHSEMWRNWRTLDRAIDRINALEPDLIVFTGDFVDVSISGMEDDLCTRLKRLRARDGMIAVMGNHDYWDDAEAVRAVLAQAGVRDVSNGVHTLTRGADRLHIAGVDSAVEVRALLNVTLDAVPDDGAAILLAHEPDFAIISAATGRFDLQLSGHSHGGQVRVPFLMDLFLPPLSRRYVMGLYEREGMLLYVNRGLGMSGLHMRFLCRPEVTLFTLSSPAAQQ
jgi:predicted MPP superfamily phosphohydrolase